MWKDNCEDLINCGGGGGDNRNNEFIVSSATIQRTYEWKNP